jgi:hypothetical protein
MIKDNKINVKLEVCKDNLTGKLSIRAHFDTNAPNIYEEKDGFYWIPTNEEKDFINETFKLIPLQSNSINPDKQINRPIIREEKKQINIEERITEPEIQSEIDNVYETPTIEERLKEPILKKNREQTKSYDFLKETNNVNQIQDKEPIIKSEEIIMGSEKEQVENEKMIGKADTDAIEAALLKHTKKEPPLSETDEKIIVDKILNQKKKEKWFK